MTKRPQLGDWHSLEELARVQDKHLPVLLSRAAHSPFYRSRPGLPSTREELESFPLTTKQDLREAYPFGLLAVEKERLATYHESSGTAGQPTASYYTQEDWADLTERYSRKWVPMTASDMFLVRTPYALMITGHLAHASARSYGATVVPGDNRSSAMPYSRVVRVLHDLDVTLTWSMATETLLWAAAARAAGYSPGHDFPKLRALYVGGDPLSPARRRRIEEIWRVPVVEEYGSTETGSLAGQCEQGHLHLWADRAIFEVYRPETGETVPEGRGQLVVTPLFREAMPLLRYNLEDTVEVSYDDCPCGWNLPTVRVLGRTAFGYRVGEATVTQAVLEDIVYDLPLEHEVLFWRASAQPTVLRVEIEVGEEHRAGAEAALTQGIERRLGARCEVTGVPPGTLVPRQTLTGVHDVVKPRSLFAADEDWDKALLYY
ncbi:AMP-binding protein [Nonomuraea typhae]|uniref:AMP-binding protein n=1 Tax=Nonomuraea typhae TaxID=2603600 RepID=A0ABW7YQQ8_9ACTN